MRIGIIGSRNAPANIAVKILGLVPANTTEIVSGGANGVDKAAELVAETLSIPLRRFEPDYSQFGKSAPLKRNLEIIQYADELLAFWDGQSRGTMHCIGECIRQGKPIRVVPLQYFKQER